MRETEKLARDIQAPPAKKSVEGGEEIPENLQKAGIILHEKIGAAINIKRNNKGQGSLVIKFGSEEDLERILGILNKE